jgi:hypothetical protein
MKHRFFDRKPFAVHAVFLAGSGLIISCLLSGCGALAAVTKPSTLMAPKDEAPLTVVVQRADAASATATQVDRLLTATPAGQDSGWPQQTQLSPEAISDLQSRMADHPYYDGTSFRISPAIVWADELATIHGDSGTSPSLLAAISTELGAAYTGLQTEIGAIAALEGRLKTEELARDQENLSEADRKTHQSAVDKLKAELEKSKAHIDPAKQAFVTACRAASAKVPPDTRQRFAVAIVNLRQAVQDADVANGVAVMRYSALAVKVAQNPLLLKDALIAAAKANVSDYVFEQTGKRLKFSALAPTVKFEDGKLDLALNGVSPEDLGTVQLDQLVVEATTRTEHFAVEAVALLATTSTTEEELSFEGDVLDAIGDGFRSAGWQSTEPARISALNATQIHANAAGSTASHGISIFGK